MSGSRPPRSGAELIDPSCGASINAGPGASKTAETVTVSAQNRNFAGRSGPGKLYLASPYVVAASAIAGKIVETDGFLKKVNCKVYPEVGVQHERQNREND